MPLSNRYMTYIIRPAAIAGILLTFDIILSFVALLLNLTGNLFYTVADWTIFEFAMMLILGGCLMARQPLEDEQRYDEAGEPSKAWSMYLFGRDLLLISVFTLLFGGLFIILGSFI